MKYTAESNFDELARLIGVEKEDIPKYECIYDDMLLCNIKQKDGEFYYVSDEKYLAQNKYLKFVKSERFPGMIEKKTEKTEITGYKNFGTLDINGKTAYWVCKAANGEDSKLPSKLDYFRITKTEYDARTVLQDSIDTSFITSMTVQAAKSTVREKEKIRCAILGIEENTNENLAALLGIELKDEEKEEEKVDKTNFLPEKKTKAFSFPVSKSSDPDDYDDDEDDEEGDKKGGLLGILSNFTNIDAAKKKKIIRGGIAAGIFVILLIVAMSVVNVLTPGTTSADLAQYYNIEKKNEAAIIYNGEITDKKGMVFDGRVYVTYDFMKENLNDRLYYDKDEELMIYATAKGLVEFHKDSKTISVDGGTKTLKYEPYKITNNGDIWISLDFMKDYSAFTYEVYEEPYRAVITNYTQDTEMEIVKAVSDSAVRAEANRKSPILKLVKSGDELVVKDASGEGWIKVVADGLEGYIQSESVGEPETKTYKKNVYEEEFKHNLYSGKVCMLWHQISNLTANNNIDGVLAKAQGINIICPTWFYLNDAKGGVADLGSESYVKTCHDKGIMVWGLVSNIENPDIDTHEVLSSTPIRRSLINNIIAVAQKYDLDGINIDFEALSEETGEPFIQFIRELALALDETDIVLSVDNYVPSEYTMFYDREEQACFADYIVVMAYDEHINTSGEAGSVASYPWVKEGLQNTLKEVPKKQVVLGIPFYTRVWKTVDGKLTSESVGMEQIINKLNESNANINWDKKLGQFYATYTDEEDRLCETWVEDTNSISYKLALMRSENISGAAFWKAGLEPKSLWADIIKGYSNPEPAKESKADSTVSEEDNTTERSESDEESEDANSAEENTEENAKENTGDNAAGGESDEESTLE